MVLDGFDHKTKLLRYKIAADKTGVYEGAEDSGVGRESPGLFVAIISSN